jgi:hypothetical protein
VNEALEALRPLISIFEELGIAYRVGGSLASSFHGKGRSTLDADLVARLDGIDLSLFVQKLQGIYYADLELIREGMNAGTAFNLIYLETFIKIDIFPLQKNLYDQQSFSRFIVSNETFFVSAEDIILKKLQWFRLSDGSERQWRDIAGVFEAQLNSLEYAYLRQWAKELEILDLLEKAIQASQSGENNVSNQ